MLGSFQPLGSVVPLAGWDGGVIATPTGPATIREAVRSRLASIDALTAKVGGRIWFYNLPQGGTPVFPAITFYVAARTFDADLDGPNGVSEASIRISCWSNSPLEAAATAETVRTAFDGFQGWIGSVYVMGCSLESEADLPEYPRNDDDVYTHQTVLTFSVDHIVSIPAYS